MTTVEARACRGRDELPQAINRDRRIVMAPPDVSLPPYIRQAGEHQRLAYTGGHELAVVLDAVITDGQLTVIDVHAWVGDQRHQLRPGGIAFLPRQMPHAIRYDIASRALVLSTPAGSQEGVFRATGWDLSQPRPNGWQIPPEALRKAAEQNGVTLTGPPHGLDD